MLHIHTILRPVQLAQSYKSLTPIMLSFTQLSQYTTLSTFSLVQLSFILLSHSYNPLNDTILSPMKFLIHTTLSLKQSEHTNHIEIQHLYVSFRFFFSFYRSIFDNLQTSYVYSKQDYTLVHLRKKSFPMNASYEYFTCINFMARKQNVQYFEFWITADCMSDRVTRTIGLYE